MLQNPAAPTGLLKTNDVAEWFGKSPWQISRLANAGILPSVRIGRSRRFVREQLEAFLAGGGNDESPVVHRAPRSASAA